MRSAVRSILCLFVVGLTFAASKVGAHCEIPCGIYGDETRLDLLDEHIRTVEKSMQQIQVLSKQTPINQNQLVRWVTNKESHAQEIQEIVSQYFLAQRVKPAEKTDAKAYAAYVEKVTLLHQMIISAMKAKQTTDLAHVEALRGHLTAFRKAYMGH